MSIVSCPHCGGDIRADAKSCRHCGSSDSDGWRDELDDGDDEFDEFDDGDDGGDDDFDFDYDSFVEDEFPSGMTNTETAPLWRFVAVVLLLLIFGFVISLLRLF